MSHSPAVSGRQVIERWANLAERRLDYLTDLFETGRWRRFHTELDFLDNIREAKAAVDRWREMATQEATIDNRQVTWSWLDRPDGVPTSYRGRVLHEVPRARVVEAPAVIEFVMPLDAPALQPPSEPAPTAEPALDWRHALDPDVLGERYPMLRAAM